VKVAGTGAGHRAHHQSKVFDTNHRFWPPRHGPPPTAGPCRRTPPRLPGSARGRGQPPDTCSPHAPSWPRPAPQPACPRFFRLRIKRGRRVGFAVNFCAGRRTRPPKCRKTKPDRKRPRQLAANRCGSRTNCSSLDTCRCSFSATARVALSGLGQLAETYPLSQLSRPPRQRKT